MIRRIVFNHPLVGPWVAERARAPFNPDSDSTIGIVSVGEDGERVRGGCIYTMHTDASCFMHIAGADERWGSREFAIVAFTYPFGQLGYPQVFGIMEEANEPNLRFGLRIGFERLYNLPRMFPSGDGVLLGMSRESCRWIRLKLRGYGV